MGKHWMTKFYFGKTQENMQKHGKTLDNKDFFWENTGKHAKTWENIG